MRKKYPGARSRDTLPALLTLCLLAMLTVIIVACSTTTNATGSNNSSGDQNTVHMNDSNFVQSSITIKKGTSLTLVNDTSAVHIITNGTWDNNGTAKPNTEPGAPTVNSEIDGGVTRSFGPFTTAGTFQLYCTVHPGMNLTVIVN